jgi:hypothetical protein
MVYTTIFNIFLTVVHYIHVVLDRNFHLLETVLR